MYYLTKKALIAIIYHTEVRVLNTLLADCEGLFEHTPRVSQLHRGPPGIKLRLGSILSALRLQQPTHLQDLIPVPLESLI